MCRSSSKLEKMIWELSCHKQTKYVQEQERREITIIEYFQVGKFSISRYWSSSFRNIWTHCGPCNIPDANQIYPLWRNSKIDKIIQHFKPSTLILKYLKLNCPIAHFTIEMKSPWFLFIGTWSFTARTDYDYLMVSEYPRRIGCIFDTGTNKFTLT